MSVHLTTEHFVFGLVLIVMLGLIAAFAGLAIYYREQVRSYERGNFNVMTQYVELLSKKIEALDQIIARLKEVDRRQ